MATTKKRSSSTSKKTVSGRTRAGRTAHPRATKPRKDSAGFPDRIFAVASPHSLGGVSMFAPGLTIDASNVRAFESDQGLWCLATNQLQTGDAEGIAVVFNQQLPTFIRFDGQHPATRVSAHPFNTDRTAASADIPQQFAGCRCEAGEGDGAHVALGQLAVVLEG